MRMKGKIVNWNESKAFGFIQPNGGGEQIFIHKSALLNRRRTPQVNDKINFLLSTDKQDRYCAAEATFSDEKSSPNNTKPLSVYLSLFFITSLTIAAALRFVPKSLVTTYLVLGAITYMVYWIDKSKAKNGQWRIPESTLHLLSALGGWPGAAFAQHRLRHKSQKTKFRAVFGLTLIINLTALSWLISDSGAKWLALLQ